MWVLWWFAHHPSFDVPRPLTLTALVLVQLAGVTIAARRAARGSLAGAATGFVAAAVNLLLVLSWLVNQPESTEELQASGSTLHPNAAIVIAAYLGASTLVGAAIGALVPKRPPANPAPLACLAAVAAASFLPLLVVGGTVTSTESGLAVPDPVTTFGVNPFLFPLSLMAGDTAEPRVFFEHTHRLFGWLVGLNTLTLFVATLITDNRRWTKLATLALGILVAIQGALGALRVGEQSVPLAILHGIFGQAVFAYAAALAGMLSPAFANRPAFTDATFPAFRRRHRIALIMLGTLAFQLTMGAAFRHLRREGSPGAMHALWTHAGFSIFVVILAVALGAMLSKRTDDQAPAPATRRIGKGLMHVVALQFLLGWGAFIAVMMGGSRGPVPEAGAIAAAPDVPWWEALVATLHQANGALLLALTALAVTFTRPRRG